MKWQRPAGPEIVDKHIALTKQVIAHRPDLIIWPETSCSDYLWDEHDGFDRIRSFVRRARIPLLFGSVLKEGKDYSNAAILLSKEGEVVEIYRKVHLVPFGEFLPLRRWLPFISDLLGLGDFTRGRQHTVFSVPARDGRAGRFSALVCFEDTVAQLSRKSTAEGAQLLVNITNDAWFGDTKSPFMHLQSSVFRTVENRRGLVRAANTGVSGVIDPWGRIIESREGTLFAQGKKTYVSGYTITEAPLGTQETLYTKFGDVFAILCFGCILVGIISNNTKY